MYHQPLRFILASASPRRRELLTRAGYTFHVLPADVDERLLPDEAPADYVKRLAESKARTVAATNPHRIVVGADTVVVCDGAVMGKPTDDSDASAMLRSLSGRVHEVLTGVAVVAQGACRVAVETTAVRLVELDDATIEWYVATGECSDKAGAYGVQGIASRFVDSLEGSYTNVVGLPVSLVSRFLRDATDQR